MKVFQVNCVYKRGSTGKIVEDIHKALKEKDIESIIDIKIQEKLKYRLNMTKKEKLHIMM